MKIDKVSVKEINFEKDLKNSKFTNPELQKVIPKMPTYVVTFEIHDVPASVPNAIRRTIIDYIPVKILKFDMYEDFDCDDLFLTCDQFNHNIGCIHVDQESKFNGSIDIANDSPNELMEIRTSHIKPAGQIAVDYPIGYLRPKTYLKIKNITKHVTRGCDDGRAKCINGAAIYEILDVKPYDQFTGDGEKSLVKLARSFRIGYETRRTKDDKLWPLQQACNLIMESAENIKKSLEEDGDRVLITSSLKTYTYTIFGEYFTIVDLLRDFIYEELNGSVVVISTNKSFEEDTAIIRIQHPDHKKLVISACAAIKKTFAEIYEYVKKNAK